MHEVRMPKLTHDMQSGVLVAWAVEGGEAVKRGARLFDVETDKATVEVEAEADGVLAGVRVAPGDEVSVGAVMAYLLAPGESLTPQPPVLTAKSAVRTGEAVPNSNGFALSSTEAGILKGAQRSRRDTSGEECQGNGVFIASPIAKRIAAENNIDLATLAGSGPRGRIIERDLLATIAAHDAADAVEAEYDVLPLSTVRRRTGERLAIGWAATPQFVLEAGVDMTEALRLRDQVEGKPSITALLVRVTAAALRDHPEVNAAFVDGELRRYRRVNIGVATAISAGLIVPVIHDAGQLNLAAIVRRLDEIRSVAATGRFSPSELAGGTFTISNLGPFGIDAFTAVVNPPQAAILAVGQIISTPVGRNGAIELRPVMCLRLSVDHRALDGALAAPFLSETRALLENPYWML